MADRSDVMQLCTLLCSWAYHINYSVYLIKSQRTQACGARTLRSNRTENTLPWISVPSLGLIKTHSNECLLICLCTCAHTYYALSGKMPCNTPQPHANMKTLVLKLSTTNYELQGDVCGCVMGRATCWDRRHQYSYRKQWDHKHCLTSLTFLCCFRVKVMTRILHGNRERGKCSCGHIIIITPWLEVNSGLIWIVHSASVEQAQ